MHIKEINIRWQNKEKNMELKYEIKGCIVRNMMIVIHPKKEQENEAYLTRRDLIKGRGHFFIILAICSFHQVILARSNPKEDSKYDKIASFQE